MKGLGWIEGDHDTYDQHDSVDGIPLEPENEEVAP